MNPYSLDAMFDQYAWLKEQAVLAGATVPVMLAVGTPDPATYAWQPVDGHPVDHAIGVLERTMGATWACYLADDDNAAAVRLPADMRDGLDVDDEEALLALVRYLAPAEPRQRVLMGAWVSVDGPTVLVLRPYHVEHGRLRWLDDQALDTRTAPNAQVAGAAPAALRDALVRSVARSN